MQKILVQTTLAIAVLFSGAHAFSAVLTTQPGPKVVEGIKIDTGAAAALAGGAVNLTTVGAGLRAKSVPILGAVKVYVGEFMVSNLAVFDRTAPLASIDKMQAVAAVFTFKRGLNIDQITGAFEEMFKTNNINAATGPVAQFLQMVSTLDGVNSGDKMAIIGERNKNGSETIYFQAPNNVVKQVAGPAGFVHAVFNFWFGRVNDDSGLVQFQQTVLSGSRP